MFSFFFIYTGSLFHAVYRLKMKNKRGAGPAKTTKVRLRTRDDVESNICRVRLAFGVPTFYPFFKIFIQVFCALC